ncbi:MAG: hypothetical protein IID38_07605, partial [Planctomycetes bacterium]|nr:hypothetical protein [Planctomycetota bacterium]
HEQSDRAAGLLERLTKSIGPCETVATQLTRHIEKAGGIEQSLSEENEKAGKLAGRLAAAGRLLASAKEIESTAQRAAEDTRATYDNLIAESETAKNHIDRMQELCVVSRELIDSQNCLHREAQRSSTSLSEQVANAQDAIESGQQVLAGFVTQAEMFENQLKGLADRTQRMERTIAEVTSKPDSIVESAKFQAAKLEQVCGAVRKVFAGLSRTSLEAHQQTKQMRQTGQDASRRLAELTIQTQRETKQMQQIGQDASRRLAELTVQTQRETKRIQQTGQDTSRRLTELTVQTQRAARTLQEWVEEAVRVQSRLDRTLAECPSIRETHPSETIRQLSEARFPIHDIAEARSGGALEMLRDPEPRTKPKEVAATQPPTRTEQVAQLIEQAKQSAPATR